ncbi:MAG: Ig-like domain-containing protein [Bradymonadaceae bacterium]|nr:Ig-like domain-containing protein [Lujinxingiaceae bacterium]
MTNFSTTRNLFALGVCLLLVVACGDSTGSSNSTKKPSANNSANNATVNNANNTNNNTNNTNPLPTGPAYLTLSADPLKAVYAPDAEITPKAEVFDAQGVRLNGAEVSWSFEPAASIEAVDGGRLKLIAEGLVLVRACTNSAAGSAICATKTLVVDAGPPQLTIHAPKPGDELSSRRIEVRGTAIDSRDDVYVYVNGQAVAVDTDGSFSANVEPHFGINHLEIVATDGLHALSRTARLDVLWAPEFYATQEDSTRSAVRFEDGIALKLGQNFFDNKQPPLVISELQIVTEDLADILYLLLRYIDLNEQIPDPVVDTTALLLRVTDTSIEDPQVEIDMTDEGLELFIRVPELVATTAGHLQLGDALLDLSGSIVARMSIRANILVSKPSANEPFVVELESFELAIETAEARFQSDAANAIFELAQSALRAQIEAILLDTVNTSFVELLPDLLRDIFNSLETALIGQSFPIDLGAGDAVTLLFDGRINRFEIRHKEAIEATIRTDVAVEGAPLFAHSRGVALSVPYSNDLPFFFTSRIQVGLRLGLINGIFHTLWNGGLLELDVKSFLPDNLKNIVSAGHISSKLPPVIAPPTRGEPFDLLLSLGQLEMTLEHANQQDTYGANISVGAQVVITGGAIAIQIADKPEIRVWLISTTGNAPRIPTETLHSLILNQLWPQIKLSLGEGLSFGLPVPDLSMLDQYAPALSNLELDLRMTQPLSIRDEFIVLDAGFEGLLPLLP